MIESAFQDLLRGIEVEKSRLHGATYLVVEFRLESDIDGLTEHLTKLGGFTGAKAADDFSLECVEARKKEFTTQLGDGRDDWVLDTNILQKRCKTSQDNDHVKGLKLLSWKGKNRQGFSSIYMQIEVVRIRDHDVVGKELLRDWDAESVWISYFIDCGRRARSSNGGRT